MRKNKISIKCDRIKIPIILDKVKLVGIPRKTSVNSVLNDTYIEIILMYWGNNKIVLLVGDILYWPEVKIVDKLKKRISNRYKINENDIILGCTHCHSNIIPCEDREIRTVYFSLCSKILQKIGEMEERKGADEFEIGFSKKKVTGLTRNRRVVNSDGFVLEDWDNGVIRKYNEDIVNAEGPEENEIAVLCFKSKIEEIAIVSFSSHIHTFPINLVNGELPSFLKKMYNNESMKMIFINGMAGNVCLNYSYDKVGQNVDRKKYMEMNKKIASKILMIVNEIKYNIEYERIRIQKIEVGNIGEYTIKIIRINNVYLVSIPGEMYIEYRSKIINNRVLLLGYNETTCGYIGHEMAYERGGYGLNANKSDDGKRIIKYINKVCQ